MMMRIAICLMAFMATMVLGLQAPIPGYAVVDVVWEVDPWNNGTMLNITGPVEHVYGELKKINPDLVKNITTGVSNGFNSAEEDRLILSRQTGTKTLCGPLSWGWKPADHHKIIFEGVPYLKGVVGKPAQGPGPGSCGRVSCSYQSAIWWCNDDKTEKILPGFATIADCAENTCIDCATADGPGPNGGCVGQTFMPGNWNCIVRHDEDSC